MHFGRIALLCLSISVLHIHNIFPKLKSPWVWSTLPIYGIGRGGSSGSGISSVLGSGNGRGSNSGVDV